jgi:glycosyltransferase involved in cell wall biosynthesis
MDIVWFAEIKWDYLRTRKQQIIRRKPDDVRLLYLEPYIKGRENHFDLRECEGVEGAWRATVPFVKAIPGGWMRAVSNVPAARSLVDAFALPRVRRLVRRAGMTPRTAGAVISNVYAVRLARRFGGRFLVYDCNDAHSEFPGMPAWTHRYFEETCRTADEVFASSSALAEDISALREGDRVTFLGNGVDYDHFEKARIELGKRAESGPPCIGYLGAVAPWLDFDVIVRVATERPGWRLRIVGPVLSGVAEQVERLRALPNVSLEEAVSYDRVPEVMHGFSVGLIPFRCDNLTRAVNPNKMYEYLAMGVPVVSTRFSAEVERYPGLVTAAADAGEFLVACDAFVAMHDDRLRADAFRTDAGGVASEHDWGVIASSFWERIHACIR